MNIYPVPPTGLASLAGTQRAAAKGTDLDQAAAAEAARQRADAPAGDRSDVAEIERDAAAGDSGADGRQAYERGDSPQDASAEQEDRAGQEDRARQDPNKPASPASRDSASGQHLDLQA
ncbi:hypothetical protein [Roseimaritima sediminicola]|uniref:hypothetical protein n=1 Tax=Roseimaritima sediminicola TaxID=2662066 RepID=UPI0012982800|nr:hypothetical protein [Roseimaritima sediminicola]